MIRKSLFLFSITLLICSCSKNCDCILKDQLGNSIKDVKGTWNCEKEKDEYPNGDKMSCDCEEC